MTHLPQSERLTFRVWVADDLPLAQALWTDPAVMRYMGGAMSPAAAGERLALEMARQERYGFQYWPMFLRSTGEHAGCAGLRPFHDQPGVLEVGVHRARACWSLRLGEEAARAVIDYAWRQTTVAALVAGHGPGNEHSRALLGRLGFRYTHHEPWGPQDVMHPYYRLDRPEVGRAPTS